MTNYEKLEHDIESIVDSLKGICTQIGVANASGEERIITTVFLYKFLNDKFMFNLSQFSHETGIDYKDILENKNNELDAFYDAYSGSVAFEYKDTIEYLIQYASQQGFYKMFDAALENISNNPRNIAFNLERKGTFYYGIDESMLRVGLILSFHATSTMPCSPLSSHKGRCSAIRGFRERNALCSH